MAMPSGDDPGAAGRGSGDDPGAARRGSGDDSYLQLLRAPGVARALGGALAGRLPTGMAALAIALLLRDGGVGFGTVGAAATAYGLAAVVGGPLLARAIDRRGQTVVLVASALVSAAAFVALALVPPASTAPIMLAAIVAGAATPPLEPSLRALWPSLAGDIGMSRAYSLDAGTQELVFVGGPLIVAVCAEAGSPAAALVTAAILCLAGTAALASGGPSRRWRPAGHHAGWLGALRSRGVLVLVIGLAGAGGAVGALGVFAVAYAEDHSLPGGAGALLALNAFGGLIGALAYGRRKRGAVPWRDVALAAWCQVAGFLPLVLVPGPAATAGLALVAGISLPPLLAASFFTIDDMAVEGTITEAFAWLIALFGSGAALGAGAMGVALDTVSLSASAALMAATAAAGATVLTVAYRAIPAFRRSGSTAPDR